MTDDASRREKLNGPRPTRPRSPAAAKRSARRRRQAHQGEILPVGAVEVQDGGAGPAAFVSGRSPIAPPTSPHGFVAANLAPGAAAKTDRWSGAPGVRHDPRVIGKMAARIVPPRSRRIFSNLKVRASGGACAADASNPASTEFVFRFNRRRTRHAAFRSPIGIAAARKPVTCNMSISPEAKAQAFRHF